MTQLFNKDEEDYRKLNAKNELYAEFAPQWDFFMEAYEGGRDFASGKHLFKHVRENQADFEDRIKRLDNLNYCEGLVDFFTNFIFSEPIERDGAELRDWYTNFIEDVNLKGDGINAFMRQISTLTQVYGTVYVQVDQPQIPQNQLVTAYDAAEQKLRSYWVTIKPSEVFDWLKDDLGAFIYLRRSALSWELDGRTKRKVQTFTEFYVDRYVITKFDLSEKKPKMLGEPQEIPHTLGVVPIKVAHFKKSMKNPDIGLSFLRDLAGNQRKILNLTSMLDDFLYRQAFNILAKETDSMLPTLEQNDGVIGTSNLMEVPKGAAFPQYISPPIDPAKMIQSERQRITGEMFKRAAQDTVNEMYNGEKSSGFSQAQSFSKTVPHISTRADTLEAFEIELMKLTCKFEGKDWKGKVKYKDRYEITNLTDALTQLLMIVGDLALPSETFVKEQLKRIVREFDGKLPPETLTTIYQEVETYDFKKWQDAVQNVGGKVAANQQKPKGTGTMAEVKAEAKVEDASSTKKLKTT